MKNLSDSKQIDFNQLDKSHNRVGPEKSPILDLKQRVGSQIAKHFR